MEKWSLRREKKPRRKAKPVFFFGWPEDAGNAKNEEELEGSQEVGEERLIRLRKGGEY